MSVKRDPRLKHYISESLRLMLYSPLLDTNLIAIIKRNMVICRHTHMSFMYKGGFYCRDDSQPPRKINRLHESLFDGMEAYITEVDHVNRVEMPAVLGFIRHALNATDNLSDYLKIFPECAHGYIKKATAAAGNGYATAQAMPVEKLEALVASNHTAITMIKSRMVLNLIV